MKAKGAPPPMDDTTGVPIVNPDTNGKVVRLEEHIEYRDEAGNVLNDEQVKALEGQVEFKTRYETKTRLVDEYGNELPEGYVVDGLEAVDERGEEKVVEPEPVPVELAPAGINEETPKGEEQKPDEQIEAEGTISDERDNTDTVFTQ